MKFSLRPLPLAIGIMALLACVKTAGLVGEISVGSAARASTPAHEAKAPAAPLPAKTVLTLTPAAPDAAQTPPEPVISEGERTALQDLRARRTQLDTRASKSDEREALLSAAERRLADRIQQLAVLQTKLEQLEKERHGREEANWRGFGQNVRDDAPARRGDDLQRFGEPGPDPGSRPDEGGQGGADLGGDDARAGPSGHDPARAIS